MPVLILGDSLEEFGINKILAKQMLLGNLDQDEVYEIVVNKKNCMDFRCEKIFRRIDTDNSNSLEISELRE